MIFRGLTSTKGAESCSAYETSGRFVECRENFRIVAIKVIMSLFLMRHPDVTMMLGKTKQIVHGVHHEYR